MTKLEDLRPNASVRGILPNCLVTVVSTQWFGSQALELTYKEPSGKVANEYRGLRCGEVINISEDNLSGLLVRPEIALKQRETETATVPGPGAPADPTGGIGGGTAPTFPPEPATKNRPKRFHGSVNLDPARVGRDAGSLLLGVEGTFSASRSLEARTGNHAGRPSWSSPRSSSGQLLRSCIRHKASASPQQADGPPARSIVLSSATTGPPLPTML
jgi:hypothetical protein